MQTERIAGPQPHSNSWCTPSVALHLLTQVSSGCYECAVCLCSYAGCRKPWHRQGALDLQEQGPGQDSCNSLSGAGHTLGRGGGLPQIDKFLYSKDNYVVAGE